MPQLIDADKLAGALERLPGRLADETIEKALFDSAEVPLGVARRTTAFKDRSGRLRKSFWRRRGRKKYRPSVFVGAGGPGARQAYNVEHGHSGLGVSPHPYFIPAVERSQDKVFNQFTAAMQREYDIIVRELKSRISLRSRTARAISEGPV